MKKVVVSVMAVSLVVVSIVGTITISHRNYRTTFWQTIDMINETRNSMAGLRLLAESDTELNNRHEVIKRNMEKLKKSPSQYKEAYKILLELYMGYREVYTYFNLGMKLSGVELLNTSMEAEKIISKLEILIPPPKKK